jgi:uncharacterized protein (TIGR00369 family)
MKPHLENLKPLAHAAQNRCFGCGEANPTGLQLRFLLAPDGTVVCPVSIPASFEGHPGYLHGGIIATLLDETMSKAVRARGLSAMTRHLEVDYRRPVPSAATIRMEGRIDRSEGRKHWVEAWIFDEKNSTLAHSKGLFVELRPSRAVSPLPAELNPTAEDTRN